MKTFGITVNYSKKQISIPRDYSRLEPVNTFDLDNVLFTKIVSEQIGSLKMASVINIVEFIGVSDNLKISKKKDWDAVQDKLRILVTNN